MKRIATLFVLLFFLLNTHGQNLLPEKWKFKTGDDPAWSSVDYDDSGWEEIIAGMSWEKQGHNIYDGFAWYRVKVTIPSSLKETVKKYGGMRLHLGMIDDVDFTWFNGELLGETGELPPHYVTMYNIDRDYTIPVGKIRWDQPNTIAVRVFDLYGDGGMYTKPVYLAVKGVSKKLGIHPVFSEPDYIVTGTKGVELKLNVSNSSSREINGKMNIQILSDFGDMVTKEDKPLLLHKKSSQDFTLKLDDIQPGFYKVTATFEGDLAYKPVMFNFGYDPEKIVSPPDRPDDFKAFWDKAKEDLAAVDPNYRLTKVDSLCTKHRDVYLVEMQSLGDILIRGWYSVPTTPGVYPAIMQVPGYTGTIYPDMVNYGDDIIGLGLNIRGHGNSQDDVNPGFPGFLFDGIEDKETYIYRGAYMDCLRGIDFLFTRPEVDKGRVGVEGSSQGGALTFATAALDNERIKVCVPQVPFLSDFRDYFKVAVWPGNEFKEFVEVEKKMSWDEVYDILRYFDIKNLAGWIKAPMLMGAGLMDQVCPPHINFAAYNQVTSEKHYIVYPYSGHGLPEEFYIPRTEFIRAKFGLK